MTDFIFKNNLPIDVFTIDTGRLFQESYDVLSSMTFFPNDKEELVSDQQRKTTLSTGGFQIFAYDTQFEIIKFNPLFQEFRIK